jgi:membrane protease YdiL (CAAX protease family)
MWAVVGWVEMPDDLVTVLEKLPVDALREPPTERTVSKNALRWFELGLVLLIAFGDSIFRSAILLREGTKAVDPVQSSRWLAMIVHEAAALLLLGYVLIRRGMRIRELGLRWSWGELGRSLLVTIGAYAAYAVSYPVLVWVQRLLMPGATGVTPRQMFGHASWIMFATVLINPFFEELIVRAYLMTEVQALTGSWVLATAASVAVQTSYHLYYGWVGALAVGAQFLVFSVYYAKTRRATPVIVAHGVFDLLATAMLR